MAALLCAAVLTVLAASPAGAVPPERFTDEFADEFTETAICGFPIDISFVGSVRGTEFFDRAGNLVSVQVHGEDVGTITNPANGKTAGGVDHWLETIDVVGDEFAILGLFFHLNSRRGHRAARRRHIRFDANGESIHLAGPHQAFEGDFAALCAALA